MGNAETAFPFDMPFKKHSIKFSKIKIFVPFYAAEKKIIKFSEKVS